MKKLSALLMVSVFVLSAWGPPGAAEPPAGEGPARSADSAHSGETCEKRPRMHESYGDVVLRHMDDLKLSDEQIGKIARIHQNNQQKIRDIGKKLRETRTSAYRLFLNPASDEAAIRNAAKDHTAAFDALVETALKSRAAIDAVLTQEQLNRLKSLKAEP